MKPSHLSFALLMMVAWSLAPATSRAGDSIVINDSNLTRSEDCKGGSAVVNGNHDVLAFRNCDKVVVNGNGSTIDAGAVRALSVLGNENKVTWTEGREGRQPVIATLGSGNVVAGVRDAGGAGGAQVSMSGGQVTASNGRSTVTVDGAGVTVGAAGTRQAIVVNDNGQSRTYDCHGGSAVVNGNESGLTFKNCAAITINGNDNTITAGVVQSLSVLGNTNNVTWTEGPDGRKPSISNVGDGNKVSRAQ